jgi:CheY-like chemotaxis protein
VTISAPRIAVLEDDPAFREVLLAILDDQHLAGTVLDPGAGAIAQLLELRPHIAIIDWHVVGMGSAETAEELLRDIAADPDLVAMRTILCSGDMTAAREIGPSIMAAVDLVVLEKPFDVDTFVGVLERALRRAGVAEDATLTVALPRPAPNPEIAGRLGGASVHAQAIALLEAARRIGDWVTADLWLLDEDMLRCVEALPDGPDAAFAAVSRAMPILPGFGLPGRVHVSGRPAWIPDLAADRNFPRHAFARDAGLRSAAGVPLLVEPPLAGASAPSAPPTVIGGLCVYGTDPRARDDEQLAAIWALALGAADWAAVSREPLLQPPALLAEIEPLIERALAHGEFVVVDTRAANGQLYRLATAHRDPQRQLLARRLAAFQAVGAGPAGVAARTGQAQRVAPSASQFQAWARSPEHLTLMHALEARAIVSLPLRAADGTIVGVLTLTTNRPSGFSEGDERALADLAVSLGAVLERHA